MEPTLQLEEPPLIPLPKLIKSLKTVQHFRACYHFQKREIEVEIHLHELMVSQKLNSFFLFN